MARRARTPIGWLLLLLFLGMPLLEVYVIIQVGQTIGAPWTIALLIAVGVLGVWLVRREGRRAWSGLRRAVESGRMPARELADAALVLIGGTLMVTPGFVTDVVALFLIVPVTRPLARRALTALVARRVVVPPGPGNRSGRRRRPDDGDVVSGEVVD